MIDFGIITKALELGHLKTYQKKKKLKNKSQRINFIQVNWLVDSDNTTNHKFSTFLEIRSQNSEFLLVPMSRKQNHQLLDTLRKKEQENVTYDYKIK